MTRYRVKIPVRGYMTYEIEAATEQDAMDAAHVRFEQGDDGDVSALDGDHGITRVYRMHAPRGEP